MLELLVMYMGLLLLPVKITSMRIWMRYLFKLLLLYITSSTTAATITAISQGVKEGHLPETAVDVAGIPQLLVALGGFSERVVLKP